MSAVRISGTTDPAEVAAVLAVLAGDPGASSPSGYDRWRQQRLRALGRTTRVRRD